MSRLLTKRWIAVIINTVRSRGGLAQLARALDWQSRGQGFKSPILHHAKTPDFRKESGVFYLLATLMTALLKL